MGGGKENPRNNFDIDPVTLAFDLCDLDADDLYLLPHFLYNKGEMSKRENCFIYGPIFTKFGMKVRNGTLMTGKILRSGYHDNGR